MTLNARLLAGLLAVTSAGLAIMGLVSALVLRGYLMHRVDDQLQATRDRAVSRLLRPGLPEQGVAPARFVILAVGPGGRARVLSGDQPSPGRAVAEVERLGRDELAARARTLEPFSLPGLRAVARLSRNGVVVVATPLTEIDSAVRNLVLSEVATAALLLAVLIVLGRWLIGRGLLPLGRMAATAHAITAGGDLSARMPDPGRRTATSRSGWRGASSPRSETSRSGWHGASSRSETSRSGSRGESSPRSETARLAAAINVMLERIEQAFWARSRSEARVREFAADASHELRTPLTTIQGYAELYRHGALGPDELPDAMRRIEDEAARMNRLVSDLLELARLDREASLRPAPTDLAVLARDALADAAAAEPARPLVLDAPETLVATVDEARVRQVLANLLANVRAHTPPGTPATIRLAPGVIEVSDEGPGMSAADAARAFERFHRAEQGATGAGLGLPIVAAIAAAHGGRAELLSEPSKGTTVRITFGPPRLSS